MNKTITKAPLIGRRSVLAGAGALALAGALPAFAGTRFGANDLVEPPEVRARDGLLDVTVDARYANLNLGGKGATLRTYDGIPVGRTLRVKAGDTLRLRLTNSLPYDPLNVVCTNDPSESNIPKGFNVTNMHVHGVHVSPKSPADNILLLVAPGAAQNYVYDIGPDHPPGTYFYHAHFHGSVAIQVASGMAGTLIIEGKTDEIPEIKAARERVMVFQTQRFDANGYCEDFTTLFSGGPTYVNAQVAPVIRIRPGEVQRWRMVNASFGSIYDLKLEGHDFTCLTFDGNPVQKTRRQDHVQFAAGNRADVLVKGGKPGSYRLLDARDPENPVLLATVVVEGEKTEMPLYDGPLYPPSHLDPIAEKDVQFGRRLTFGWNPAPTSTKFTVNDRPFSCTDAWEIPLGRVEEWEVYNRTPMAHPFHIHVNPFQMVRGGKVEPGTWLDTVEVPPFERVTFRTRFADFKGEFVFHCHVLDHEDQGMMQAIIVT